MPTRLSKCFALFIVLGILVFGLFSQDKQYIYSQNKSLCGIYCNMGINYQEDLKAHSFDKYYFQKSLGSLVVNQAYSLLHLQLTPLSVNYGLELLSGLALVIAYFLWNAIAKTVKLSTAKYWFGFVVLFVNQLFVKLIPYAQDSPDALAFVLGMWLVLAMVRNHLIGFYCLFMLALFVQPQQSLLIIPLIMLWRVNTTEALTRSYLPRFFSPIQKGLSWVAAREFRCKAVVFIAYLLVFSFSGYVIPRFKLPYEGVDNLLSFWLPLSIVLASGFLTWAVTQLEFFPSLVVFVNSLTDKVVLRRGLVLLALLLIKGMIVSFFARGQVMAPFSTFFGKLLVLYTFHYQAVEQPLKSWIADFVFYGPAIFLVIQYWSRFKAIAQEHCFGAGILITLACIALFSVDAESRHLVGFMPLLMLMVLYAMPEISAQRLGFFAVWGILLTRFWGDYAPITPQVDPWIFSWGPWWSVALYCKALVLSIIMLASFFLASVFSNRRESVSLSVNQVIEPQNDH